MCGIADNKKVNIPEPLNLPNNFEREVSREKLRSPVKNYSRQTTDDRRRQINLRSNTHGCELINQQEILKKSATAIDHIMTNTFVEAHKDIYF